MDELETADVLSDESADDSSLNSQVDELMGQLPTVVAQRVEERTRVLNEKLVNEPESGAEEAEPTADDATTLLDEQAKLIEAEGETRLLDDQTHVMAGDEEPGEGAKPAGEVNRDFATTPGMIPVDETLLRPLPKEEQNRYVRRTRDYDHDAQSVNTVASADNFDTITDVASKRKAKRDPYARSARKGRVPGEGNSRSKLRPLLALFVIAIVLGAAGSVLTYGMELWGGKTVPSVVGDSQARAEAKLADKGFVVKVEALPADDAIGLVQSQSPEVGTRLPEGSEVTIVIATNRIMPEVVGLSEEQARTVLTEAGAEKIETKTQSSSEAEGTVIAVSPGVGEPFVSRSAVVLTLATPFRVPDVIDKKESDAVDALKAAGFGTEVTYIISDKTVRTVVETVPGPGEVISEGGTVQVKVSTPYPTDPLHLSEFFGHSSQDVNDYLIKQGYTFDQGFIDSYGNALQYFKSNEKGSMTFSSQPYLRSLKLPKDGSSNVMATGTPFAGVRFDFPSWQVPASYDRAAIDELAQTCGLEGIADICDNQSITLPAGTKQITAKFVCASGKTGDLVWTILIVGNDTSRRASATCAKESLYTSGDLAPFNGSLCQFVAYQEVYLSSEYQVKTEEHDQQKKDEHGEQQQG